jgi:hypothetical protein
MTAVGYAGTELQGIAYDDAAGVLYGTSGADLYTIDPLTGVGTLVGSHGGPTLMIGIASDGDGKIYGVDLTNDETWDIDPLTGLATSIGALGINLNFAQDIAFDKDNDILYSTGYKGSGFGGGALGTIDVTTGVYTYIADFEIGLLGVGSEVAGFAIPYEAGIPLPDKWYPCGEMDLCIDIANLGTFDAVDDPATPCDFEGLTVYYELYRYIWDDPCEDPIYQLEADGMQQVEVECGETVNVCFPAYDFSIAGVYELFFWVDSILLDCDLTNNAVDVLIGIDCCIPESDHALSPMFPDGENNWYTQDVTVTITAEDPLCPDPCFGTASGIS